MTEPMALDDKGFVELGHLEDQWLLLEALRKQREELDVRIEKGEKFFKDQMDLVNADGFLIGGMPKVVYRQNATFPAAKYAAANPAVAAAYTIMAPKLDVDALRRDRPDEVLRWTGRSFKRMQIKRGN